MYAAVRGADAGDKHGRQAGDRPPHGACFGAMLLREDAGGYVLVAVVSFAAAAAITALCMRFRIRENRKKGGTGKPDPQEQEGKTT